MFWDEKNLVAYCRILPGGVSYTEPSIGRVVSSPRYRKTGAGRLLMQQAIEIARQRYGNQAIRIGAQLYLKKFYASLGFEAQGDIYLEDGIEHVEMILL
jgi:ElaA protein